MFSNISSKKIQQSFQQESSLDFLSWVTDNLYNLPKEIDCIRERKLIHEVIQQSLSALAFVPAFKMFSNLTIKSAQCNNWLFLNATLRSQRHVFYLIESDLNLSINFQEDIKSSIDVQCVQVELYSFIKMNWPAVFLKLTLPQLYFLSEQFNSLYWTCLRISGKINYNTECIFNHHRDFISKVVKNNGLIYQNNFVYSAVV
jgi:hypothetical protein